MRYNYWVTISQENVKTTEKDVEFHKQITQIHENNTISITFLIPCISIKNSKNGIPINITNIHKPKLIKILNLWPKSHFWPCAVCLKNLSLLRITLYMYLLIIKHFVYRRYDHYNATFCRLGTNNAFSTRSPHTSSVSGLGQPQFFTINSTHSKSFSKSAKVSFDLRG